MNSITVVSPGTLPKWITFHHTLHMTIIPTIQYTIPLVDIAFNPIHSPSLPPMQLAGRATQTHDCKYYALMF